MALTVHDGHYCWFGGLLAPLGIKVAFTPVGVVVALMFIGLPFVVRSVEPVLADLGQDVEEAAATLGASGWQTFHRIILPAIRSEEHTSELQSLMRISYAVFCLKKKM